MDAICQNCAYFYEHERAPQKFCRRYPPQMIPVPQRTAMGNMELSMLPVLPVIEPGFSCGEFAEPEFMEGEPH